VAWISAPYTALHFSTPLFEVSPHHSIAAGRSTTTTTCHVVLSLLQVRRKADPAKEALQTFVRKWRDDRRVIGHPSHKEVLGGCPAHGRVWTDVVPVPVLLIA
jgi:hypothetical protein